MKEDIIRLYQEAIALLRLRNEGIELYGDFETNDKNEQCYALTCLSTVGAHKKIYFKYMKTHEEALIYFIKCSQNIYNLR